MTNSSNGEHHRGPERAKPEAARITVPSNPPTGRCKDQPDKEENDRIGEIEKTLSRKDLEVLKRTSASRSRKHEDETETKPNHPNRVKRKGTGNEENCQGQKRGKSENTEKPHCNQSCPQEIRSENGRKENSRKHCRDQRKTAGKERGPTLEGKWEKHTPN